MSTEVLNFCTICYRLKKVTSIRDIRKEKLMIDNIFDHTNDDFWGDLGLDETNDFNDDMLLCERSNVEPDYIDITQEIFTPEE